MLDCREQATVELRGWHEGSWGKYCKQHGQERLKQLKEIERERNDFALECAGLRRGSHGVALANRILPDP